MKNFKLIACGAFIVLGLAGSSLSAQVPAGGDVKTAASPHIPAALQVEHRHLHAHLARAIAAGGRTGKAAADVEALLAPHFRKEETLAMPLLGLLPSLAAGTMPAEPGSIIAMAERLKSDLPEMLREHAAIAAAVGRLHAAAQQERQGDAARFAESLLLHAQQEEQLHYPGAVLVGEYLKLKRK